MTDVPTSTLLAGTPAHGRRSISIISCTPSFHSTSHHETRGGPRVKRLRLFVRRCRAECGSTSSSWMTSLHVTMTSLRRGTRLISSCRYIDRRARSSEWFVTDYCSSVTLHWALGVYCEQTTASLDHSQAHTHTHAHTHTYTHLERETGKQTERQRDIQTDRQTDRGQRKTQRTS